MLSSSTHREPAQPPKPTMMDAATPSNDRGSGSPTTAANTFAAAAHDDLTGVIGMGTGASRHTAKVAWGGVSGGTGTLLPHRNGGCKGRLRGTAALIGMGVMPWNSGGRCAFV